MSANATIFPTRVARILAGCVVLLTLAAIAAQAAGAFDGERHALARFLRLMRAGFRPSAEGTVSAWFSAVLLLLCAMLLLRIAWSTWQSRDRDVPYWGGLALLLAFLAYDEAFSVHERLGNWMQTVYPGRGFLLWEWVIPYAAFALVVAVVYVPFALRLPLGTRTRFVVAAAIYVGGALALEGVQARIVDDYGSGTVAVAALAVLEESLEMLGVVVFVDALLSYIVEHLPGRVGVPEATDAARRAAAPAVQTTSQAITDAGGMPTA